jgi:hypothetical protein
MGGDVVPRRRPQPGSPRGAAGAGRPAALAPTIAGLVDAATYADARCGSSSPAASAGAGRAAGLALARPRSGAGR